MKKYIPLVVVMIFTITITSCRFNSRRVAGNGHVATDQRSIPASKKIKLVGSMDVIVSEGAPSVRVEAEENLLPYIKTDVDDGWLVITSRRNVSLDSKYPIKVYVSSPNINSVSVVGSGSIKSEGGLVSTNTMKFEIAGSGDIDMDINAPKVVANMLGSGSVHLTGETKDVDVDIASSGTFEGEQLKAENANISIAGSGDAIVYADAQLKVDIMGSGSVRYRGQAIVKRNVMGSGSISKLP